MALSGRENGPYGAIEGAWKLGPKVQALHTDYG
jgi:hypothetical protein